VRRPEPPTGLRSAGERFKSNSAGGESEVTLRVSPLPLPRVTG